MHYRALDIANLGHRLVKVEILLVDGDSLRLSELYPLYYRGHRQTMMSNQTTSRSQIATSFSMSPLRARAAGYVIHQFSSLAVYFF